MSIGAILVQEDMEQMKGNVGITLMEVYVTSVIFHKAHTYLCRLKT